MLHKLLFAVLISGSVLLCAQHPGMPKGKERHRHPLMFVLESDEFTAEERTELKALAEKNPRAFNEAMRRHFVERRSREARTVLELRRKVLEAKTPEEKEQALKLLRENTGKEAARRLAFQKRMLDNTQKSIETMQKRLAKLQAEYDDQLKNKDARLEEEVRNLLQKEPPKHLKDLADWQPGMPMPEPPAPPKK